MAEPKLLEADEEVALFRKFDEFLENFEDFWKLVADVRTMYVNSRLLDHARDTLVRREVAAHRAAANKLRAPPSRTCKADSPLCFTPEIPPPPPGAEPRIFLAASLFTRCFPDYYNLTDSAKPPRVAANSPSRINSPGGSFTADISAIAEKKSSKGYILLRRGQLKSWEIAPDGPEDSPDAGLVIRRIPHTCRQFSAQTRLARKAREPFFMGLRFELDKVLRNIYGGTYGEFFGDPLPEPSNSEDSQPEEIETRAIFARNSGRRPLRIPRTSLQIVKSNRRKRLSLPPPQRPPLIFSKQEFFELLQENASGLEDGQLLLSIEKGIDELDFKLEDLDRQITAKLNPLNTNNPLSRSKEA